MEDPNQSQTVYKISQILSGDFSARASFEQHLGTSYFGHIQRGGAHIRPWRTNPRGDMTCIDLLASPYLLGSLRIAILKEIIGIGPQRYCVYFLEGAEICCRLQLIMTYLPHEKMFLYPGKARLRGPFL